VKGRAGRPAQEIGGRLSGRFPDARGGTGTARLRLFQEDDVLRGGCFAPDRFGQRHEIELERLLAAPNPPAERAALRSTCRSRELRDRRRFASPDEIVSAPGTGQAHAVGPARPASARACRPRVHRS